MVAGLQVRVMAGVLVELAGKAGAALLRHNGPIAVNSGTAGLVISMSIVAVVAHCPAVGVNGLVVVPAVKVEMVAGLQVSGLGDDLDEHVGTTGGSSDLHNGPIAVNSGTAGLV